MGTCSLHFARVSHILVMDGQDDEVDPDLQLEEITMKTLSGKWIHQFGMHLSVIGNNVRFDESGQQYTLTAHGNTVVRQAS